MRPAADALAGRPAPPAAADAASREVPIRPVYLRGARAPFLAMLHATAEPRAQVAALLCPPFGWEEMSSYRPRREWARALALRGIATLRIDLPGTGDSGGYPGEQDRLGAWTEAIGAAAAWLRRESGARRVAAIGVGVGGLLAYRAAALEAPIDDLVLWGTPARGRTFIRETSAFARIEAAQYADSEHPQPELPAGWLAAGGYVLAAETRAALDEVDVERLPLARAGDRRALLLERDGIRVDARLHAALERQHVAVQTLPGPGYGQMMVEAQFAATPTVVAEQVGTWLLSADRGASSMDTGSTRAGAAAPARASTEIRVLAPDGEPVRESFLRIPHAAGSMFGVLCEPLGDRRELTVLFLGGTGHRIGQNRMWVEAARRWATWGVPSVRLDLVGGGESEGVMPPDVPAAFEAGPIEQVNAAIDALSELGSPRRTVVIGLCAAAYWTLHATLRSAREVAPIMLNPPMLVWDERRRVRRVNRYYLEQFLSVASWRRLLRGEASLSGVRALLRERAGDLLSRSRGAASQQQGPPLPGADTDAIFAALRDRGQPALILFTGQELLYHEFQREGRLEHMERWPNVTVELVPGRAGLHTLRPIWLQQEVHKLLDDALRGLLDD